MKSRDEARLNKMIIPWLGRWFWNITFVPLSDEEVKELSGLINDGGSTAAKERI